MKVGPVYASTRVGGRSRRSSGNLTGEELVTLFWIIVATLVACGIFLAVKWAPVGWHIALLWVEHAWRQVVAQI